MTSMVLIGALVLGLAGPAGGPADHLRYWGKQTDGPRGWIELGHHRYYEIQPGTEIPAWGRVKEVHDDRLVVQQRRTDEDKRRLGEQGALVYDVLEIWIPREDLRFVR